MSQKKCENSGSGCLESKLEFVIQTDITQQSTKIHECEDISSIINNALFLMQCAGECNRQSVVVVGATCVVGRNCGRLLGKGRAAGSVAVNGVLNALTSSSKIWIRRNNVFCRG